MTCTRCDKEITDMKISIKLNVAAERLNASDIWEIIPNSLVDPKETLCPECFAKFADALGSAMGNE